MIKKLLILLMLLSSFGFAEAKKQKKSLSYDDIKEWLVGLEWKKPNRTGVSSIDDLYTESDKMYNVIGQMITETPIYSLRSKVENGDTVAIVVVDQYNRLYDSFSATEQVTSAVAHTANLVLQATSLAAQYAVVLLDAPTIFADRGIIEAAKLCKEVGSVSKKVGKMSKFLPILKDFYGNMGNPIKKYRDAQSSLNPDDGFVTTGFDHVPEFDPNNMPSDEELDALLEEERKHRAQ